MVADHIGEQGCVGRMEAVLSFESSDDGLPKVVRDYRARYRAISQVLDDNPEILSAVHKDLQKLSEGDAKGRKGDYTSENILRALVVQGREGPTFRETISHTCPVDNPLQG